MRAANGILAALLVSVLACVPAMGAELEDANADADRIHSNGKTALMVAAKEGDNDRIKRLLARGANVNRSNRNGGTAIMYAALSGQPETVSMLLEHGAHVDAVAANGWTALMIAAVKGYENIARLLLDHGAQPNRADIYSWTPLMRAVYEKRLRVVRVLLEADDTDVNQPGENGVTALHLAVARGDSGAVKLLLGYGADPVVEDGSGRTALDFARQNNNMALLRMMNAGYRE